MTRKYDPSTSRLCHLTQDGSKVVRVDANNNRETLPVTFDGQQVKQVSVKYWEQIGNFACPVVRRGKELVKVFPDSEVDPKAWMPFEVKYKG